MSKTKKTITGWIRKDERMELRVDKKYGFIEIPLTFKKRGRKDETFYEASNDWPPRKVRITIEEL